MTLLILTRNLVLIIFGIIALGTIGMWLYMGAMNFRYEQDIIMIEEAIRQKPVSLSNYLFICGEFEKIFRNNQDRKRTKRALDKFHVKFYELIKEVA